MKFDDKDRQEKKIQSSFRIICIATFYDMPKKRHVQNQNNSVSCLIMIYLVTMGMRGLSIGCQHILYVTILVWDMFNDYDYFTLVILEICNEL